MSIEISFTFLVRKTDFIFDYIILIACDNNGIITGTEIMEGFSFFAKFKPTNTFLGKQLVGSSIYDFLNITRTFDKKQNKKYHGYINALEALNLRLEENKEQLLKDMYIIHFNKTAYFSKLLPFCSL